MALRTSSTDGRAPVHVEAPRADELPEGVPADAHPESPNDRGEGGRFAGGNVISIAVACPTDWDGQWSRVRSIVVGEPRRRDATDTERARRTETIAERLVRFARGTGASVAMIESYAYGLRTAAHTLGELGGVVRLELVRAGLDVRTVNMGSARKLLLGKVPRVDAGVACTPRYERPVRASGRPTRRRCSRWSTSGWRTRAGTASLRGSGRRDGEGQHLTCHQGEGDLARRGAAQDHAAPRSPELRDDDALRPRSGAAPRRLW